MDKAVVQKLCISTAESRAFNRALDLVHELLGHEVLLDRLVNHGVHVATLADGRSLSQLCQCFAGTRAFVREELVPNRRRLNCSDLRLLGIRDLRLAISRHLNGEALCQTRRIATDIVRGYCTTCPKHLLRFSLNPENHEGCED